MIALANNKTQSQLVDEFIDGTTSAVGGGAGNLKIQGNQLIHYATVIAERYEDKFILSHTRYSIVTGRIQKMLKEKIAPERIISIGRIPEGYRDSLVTKALGGAEDA